MESTVPRRHWPQSHVFDAALFGVWMCIRCRAKQVAEALAVYLHAWAHYVHVRLCKSWASADATAAAAATATATATATAAPAAITTRPGGPAVKVVRVPACQFLHRAMS
ncbi:hypothetical protein CDD81_6881 [Ophiocordyceps australis]|uniref:Uncharacterized protein n=1 Tax=Ophiocordyceps australis TaxID=1399860 RepID=A0A2C5Y4F5_9HYPO|nr:hypothetical protein CDD81_6881 [Ophiocordyceps australis]